MKLSLTNTILIIFMILYENTKKSLVKIVSYLILTINLDIGIVNAEEPQLYSLNTYSFVYHAYMPHKKFNQFFKNDLFAIRKSFRNSSYSLISGTLINSEANRCILLGLGKSYWASGRWAIEGRYMYAGEFFFKAFSHCGDAGPYQDLKKLTSVGFAPYIYQGVRYSFNKNFGGEAGVILPGIIVLDLNLSF